MASDMDWTVWGSQVAPVLTGTEQEAKNHIKAAFQTANLAGEPEPDLYLAAPNGDEFEYVMYKDDWRKV